MGVGRLGGAVLNTCPVSEVADFLREYHYLGPSRRGFAWRCEDGVMVFGKPTSRFLPNDGSWLELSRWCIVGEKKNAGSQMWARCWRDVASKRPEVTTFVSYSDPSVGHTGALYKACNWIWAPTWHRLREPPTGGGNWGGKARQSAKDRWAFPIADDGRREQLLQVNDGALRRRGCYLYQDPKRWPKR